MNNMPATAMPPRPVMPEKNPLTKYFRQPAIYIMPPSQGQWWPMGSMNIPETGEFAVYPMTSKDEVILRTPDALINGQGMVDVIESCVPDIKDAWKIPATDVDTILIAIRIASFGHNMDFEATCQQCNEEHTYSLDLRSMLGSVKCPNFNQTHEDHGLIIKFRPQAYYGLNKANKVNFEVQKLAESLGNLEDSDVRTTEAITQMTRMVNLNLEILTDVTEWIALIDDPENKIKDKNFIQEFYENADSKMIENIQTAYGNIAKEGSIPPQKTKCAGCQEDMSLEITFDYANFFGKGS